MTPPDDHIYQDLGAFRVPPNFRGRPGIVVLLWQATQATLFRLSPQPAYGWRRQLLRLFGAKVGRGVLIRPTARVTYPWKVILEDRCWIGDEAEVYNLATIHIGHDAVVSQRSYLCAGSHDYRKIGFPLVAKPIVIEPEAWIATGCFIAPGVTIGRGAIVAAMSTVTSDVPQATIVAGSPAVRLKERMPASRSTDGAAERRRSVICVGQFPPPVHGFSFITACVFDLLNERADLEVRGFSTTKADGTQGTTAALSRVVRALRAIVGLLVARRRSGDVCYIACDGGRGLTLTVLFVAFARLRGRRVLIHHHSFQYITNDRRLMRMVLAVGGRAVQHIFLCEIMRDRFARRYGAQIESQIVSNAAFLPPPTALENPRRPAEALVLGHLSNLSREKGLHIFLDLLESLIADDYLVRGILAGPVVHEDDRTRIERARQALGPLLDVRGALYGADKQQFYDEIDVFIFPTMYENEAQPIVLFEAQAAGNGIVAYGRGCIENQVGPHGLVIPEDADFITIARQWLIARMKANKSRVERAEVRNFYIARYERARRGLDDLLSV